MNLNERDLQQISEALQKTVEITIEAKVNGKIDRLSEEVQSMRKEFSEHKEQTKPMIDLVEGSVVAKKIFIWFASVILTIGAVVTLFKQ